MSFGCRTPESLLPRTDSKNPATTCKGLTNTGRPCRRSLSSQSPKASIPGLNPGVMAVLDVENVAAYYCWQHKDQAQVLMTSKTKSNTTTKIYPLKQKSSIDTLVERIGILDLNRQSGKTDKYSHHYHESGRQKPTKKENLPKQWQNLQSPLMTVPENMTILKPIQEKRKSKKSNTKFSWSCCIQPFDDDDDEYDYISSKSKAKPRPIIKYSYPTQQRPPLRNESDIISTPPITKEEKRSIRPDINPRISSLIQTELSRPLSLTSKEERGYIYIYQLTKPNSHQSTPISSDMNMNQYNKGKLMLKIGRSKNIHRRLNQWTKQCGHEIRLLRYYPYQPQDEGKDDDEQRPFNQIPHINKIERLIHLELSDYKVKYYDGYSNGDDDNNNGNDNYNDKRIGCEKCGKEHREWFEIDSTNIDGIKLVDQVVKKWVDFAYTL